MKILKNEKLIWIYMKQIFDFETVEGSKGH